MKYLKEGKVIEHKGVRFNVDYLKNTKKRYVLKQLKHVDKEVVEEVYDKVNNKSKSSTISKKTPTKKEESKKG